MISPKTVLLYLFRAIPVLCSVALTTHSYCAAQGRYDKAEGKYMDQQVKTNINKVDPLFDENIKDYQGFVRNLQEHQKGVAAGVERGVGTNEVEDAKDAGDVARDLSQISANELESRGRNKGEEEAWINEFFVDYSKPGNMRIKKDMDEIADASGKTMNLILRLLKDLGVDCKSVKGNRVIEPQYHIDLKNRIVRDKGETIYDQYFCEHPRREYNCTDELKLRCKTKGIKWGAWQDKQIRVPGAELIGFCSDKHMFRIIKTDDRVFDYFLELGSVKRFSWGSFDVEIIAPEAGHIFEARKFLATKHEGATIDNISEEMSSLSEGGHFSISGQKYHGRFLGSKDYAFETYVINYKYRDGSPACLEWNEDWSEQCQLQ